MDATDTSIETVGPSIEALQRAVEIAGGQSPLARLIGVKQSHVWNWLQTGKVPPEHLPAIHRETGVAPSEIRPDLARVFAAEFAAA